MRNAILLHGLQDKREYYEPSFPAPGNAHWFPWLQKQLLMKDMYAETPTVPSSYNATYEEWAATIERCLKIDTETALVGHSGGAGFWVRYLSEHPELVVGKVVLVAPWLDPDHDPNYDSRRGDFFDFTIDPELVRRTNGITIFVSNDDYPSILKSVTMIEAVTKDIKVINFDGMGHFTYSSMKTEEFPELLEEVLA